MYLVMERLDSTSESGNGARYDRENSSTAASRASVSTNDGAICSGFRTSESLGELVGCSLAWRNLHDEHELGNQAMPHQLDMDMVLACGARQRETTSSCTRAHQKRDGFLCRAESRSKLEQGLQTIHLWENVRERERESVCVCVCVCEDVAPEPKQLAGKVLPQPCR
jgi:hypothetical protein